DHALGPAHGQARRGRLVGHRLREPQHVVEGRLLVGVVPAPRAAQRVAQARVVDRDDGAQARLGVVVEAHPLVSELDHLLEGVHVVFDQGTRVAGTMEPDPNCGMWAWSGTLPVPRAASSGVFSAMM